MVRTNGENNIAKTYYDNINNPQITLTEDKDRDNVYHIFPIFCPTRNRLQQYLRQNGIGTMIHYPIPPISNKLIRNGTTDIILSQSSFISKSSPFLVTPQ